MGYYTNYDLDIDPNPSEDLLNETLYGGEDTVKDLLWGNWDSCKWYEHDEEMVELSKKYPKYLFTLDGEGEETGDIWRSFYKDGKTYTWKLEYEFPDFEESKLQ